jgi:hypothetical protein
VLVGRHQPRRFQRSAITIKQVGRGHSMWKQILPRVLVLRGIGLLFLLRAISNLVGTGCLVCCYFGQQFLD